MFVECRTSYGDTAVVSLEDEASTIVKYFSLCAFHMNRKPLHRHRIQCVASRPDEENEKRGIAERDWQQNQKSAAKTASARVPGRSGGKTRSRGIPMDRSAISHFENKARNLMDYEIIAIARCLKIPVAKLFED
ncbi:MAG TPA: hypothetical protein VIW67_24420 [Terriglobales bacterium]